MSNELMDGPRPSMSYDQFLALCQYINIIVVTAVPVEHEQVILDDIIPDFKANYSNYQIGYLGLFLALHVKSGQGGNAVASSVTRAITQIRPAHNDQSPVIVVMPGIACGLNRAKDDTTEAEIEEIYKHVSENKLSEENRAIMKELFNRNNDKKRKIVIPEYLTPEMSENVNGNGNRINDIILASKVWEYDRTKELPEKIQNTGELFQTNNFTDPLMAHSQEWKLKYGKNIGVYSGLLVSGDKLIRNYDFREYLKSLKDPQDDKPIVAEMESHGLAASVSGISGEISMRTARFIFAKSICDWGVAKTDDYQKSAAMASFSFIKFCFGDPELFSGYVKPANEQLIINAIQGSSSSKSVKTIASPLENSPNIVMNPSGHDVEKGFADVKWIERVIKNENSE